MNIIIKKEWYKGTDGSSISEDRCSQIIDLYMFSLSLGNQMINYKSLQELALQKGLYAPSLSDKVIRTFAPLLKKIGFIYYYEDEKFRARDLFTKDGLLFIETARALLAAKVVKNASVIDELRLTKQKIQRLGLVNMHDNPLYINHNMWIAIAFLNSVGEINWDQFGYAIYLIKGEGRSIDDAIAIIEKNESQGIVYDYYKEDGTKLANTYYSYIHSYLLEAGVLKDVAKGYSQVCDEAEEFLELLNNKFNE